LRLFYFIILLLSISSLIIIEKLRALNNLDGFYIIAIVGSLPNFISVIIFTCIVKLIKLKNIKQTIIGYSIVIVIYEVMQLFLENRYFDWVDIIFTVFGAVVMLIIINNEDAPTLKKDNI